MKYWTFTKGLPANASLGQTWKKLGLHCVGVWESLSQQNMNMKSSKPQINEKMKIGPRAADEGAGDGIN